MSKKKWVAGVLAACAAGGLSAADGPKTPGLYAIIETSEGRIVCQLFEKETPKTVANFVGLAEGTKEFTDPRTGEKTKRAYFDGIVFHRVIPEFMIQTGDPLGLGTGGPGYEFDDEIAPNLTFEKPYMLAMANRGPGTNGSQFFITVAPTGWLQGKHTIFGQVVEGDSVAKAISQVKRDPRDRPLKDVVMTKVTIQRVK